MASWQTRRSLFAKHIMQLLDQEYIDIYMSCAHPEIYQKFKEQVNKWHIWKAYLKSQMRWNYFVKRNLVPDWLHLTLHWINTECNQKKVHMPGCTAALTHYQLNEEPLNYKSDELKCMLSATVTLILMIFLGEGVARVTFQYVYWSTVSMYWYIIKITILVPWHFDNTDIMTTLIIYNTNPHCQWRVETRRGDGNISRIRHTSEASRSLSKLPHVKSPDYKAQMSSMQKSSNKENLRVVMQPRYCAKSTPLWSFLICPHGTWKLLIQTDCAALKLWGFSFGCSTFGLILFSFKMYFTHHTSFQDT